MGTMTEEDPLALSRPNRFTRKQAPAISLFEQEPESQGCIDHYAKRLEGSVMAIQVLLPELPYDVVRRALEDHGCDCDTALEALLSGGEEPKAAEESHQAVLRGGEQPETAAEFDQASEDAEMAAAIAAVAAAEEEEAKLASQSLRSATADEPKVKASEASEDAEMASEDAEMSAAIAAVAAAEEEEATSASRSLESAATDEPRVKEVAALSPAKEQQPSLPEEPPKPSVPNWLPLLQPKGPSLFGAAQPKKSLYDVQTDRLKAALGKPPSAKVMVVPSNHDTDVKGKGRGGG